MLKINFLVILLSLNVLSAAADEVKMSIGGNDSDYSTFVATEDWQEIKPGQKVPSGLHYRMNLETGKTEAKLLDPNEDNSQPSSLQTTKSEPDPADIEDSRQRLESALKNIPSEKFDDVTEEKWKEMSKKFRSYEKIKAELKDVDLNPKTEAEVLLLLINEYFDESLSRQKLEILRDIEFLMHSVDNSLLFISSRGIERILMPNLVNQSDTTTRIVSLKLFGAMMQNNHEAKKFVSESTNLGSEILNLMSKSDNGQELSSAIFAAGSLMRNNRMLSLDVLKKSIVILLEVLTRSSASLAVKVKDLVLISDLIYERHFDDNFLKSQKVCEQLAGFFEQHRNSLIVDTDSTEKCAAALLNLDTCHQQWSELAMFRHTLLVVMNNFKSRLAEETDEDARFVYELLIEHLEGLNRLLYGNLRISDDDLTPAADYRRDEL